MNVNGHQIDLATFAVAVVVLLYGLAHVGAYVHGLVRSLRGSENEGPGSLMFIIGAFLLLASAIVFDVAIS